MSPIGKKIIVLGDRAVGKTCMLISTRDGFPTAYVPLVYDNYSVEVKIEETAYTLWVGDTGGGGEDYDRLRPLSYPQTDVFLICFKATWPSSFSHVRDKWAPEIGHYCPDVPFLIVATQIDLRQLRDSSQVEKLAGQRQALISTEEGENLAHELGAAKYVECSAVTQEGLRDVFEEAVIACRKWPVEQARSKRLGVKCVIV
ncbi:GTP binding protein Cdc42 [Mycena galopus ATCC 62051]|nr:GTP binding protein Cdc42 [Mycena galopus ATCC 62051]